MRKTIAFAVVAAIILLPLASFAQNSHPKNKNPLLVVKNGKYGYIDHKGKIVIKPMYVWGNRFEDGFADVYVCSHSVWIDEKGKVVPKRPWPENKLWSKEQDGKIGFTDASGKYIISPIYDEYLPFSDGVAAVRVRELWTFVDVNGRELFAPRFKQAYYFTEGVGIVETDEGYLLIDKNGTVLASGYEYLSGITAEGRVPVSRGQKYGYLDLQGKIAIPLVYDFADSFSRGLARVKKGGKSGYIDLDGNVRIPFIFDEAGPFASGLAPVRIGKESGFIDKSGKFAFHLAFENAPGFLTGNDEDSLVADSDVSIFWTSDDRFGYVNTSGKVIWGPTRGSPDHWPLFGWTEEGKTESCKGIPRAIRKAVAGLPKE